MFAPLRYVLQRVVRHGRLTMIDASGRSWNFGPTNDFGDPGSPGGTAGMPSVVLKLADKAVERALARDPFLVLGEAYMEGRIQMVEGSIYDLLAIVMRGVEGVSMPRWVAGLETLRRGVRRFAQYNPSDRSRRNVKHHYDIDGAIYDLFLDRDRQYSCAYYGENGGAPVDLDTAQLLKKRHIAAKLDIKPGNRVLDIGCGWGGLALYLAKHCDAEVMGVTLSDEQIAIARQRAASEGLQNAVNFDLTDYRSVEGQFDRIVSIGMFEHVGVNHYGQFFEQVARLLREDGAALIHTIGRSDGPGYTNAFIAKYIFPGGYFPALSELMPAIERAGLIVSDVEVLRLHYAETLKAWRERFMEKRDRAVALRGEAFARMWEFYLAGSEAAFRYQGLIVFQAQVVRRIDALPITRDYIHAAEAGLAEREHGEQPPRRIAGE